MARSNISSDKPYRNVKGVRGKTIRRLSCPRLSDSRFAGARKEPQRSDSGVSARLVAFAEKWFRADSTCTCRLLRGLGLYFALGVRVMRIESETSPVMKGPTIFASSERSASVNFSSTQPVNAASTLYTPGFKPPKSLVSKRNVPSRCSPGLSNTASLLMRSLTVFGPPPPQEPHSLPQNVSRSCPQTMPTGEEPLGKSPPTLAARTMAHC